MSNLGPAPARGGTPDALASLRRGGLKKARASSVIADMTAPQSNSREEQQHDALHAVPPPEVEAASAAESQPTESVSTSPAPAAPSQQVAAPQVPAAEAPAQVPVGQPEPRQAPAAQYVQGPAPVQQLATYAPSADPVPVQYAQYTAPPVQAPAPEVPEKKMYRKTSFFQSKESGSRMRSAYMATRHLTGSRTLSEFILSAVEREVEELEKRYNNGNVFDVDPGSVPRGRPLET